MRRSSIHAFAALFALSLAAPLFAENGSVKGAVTDQAGAAIAGVKVKFFVMGGAGAGPGGHGSGGGSDVPKLSVLRMISLDDITPIAPTPLQGKGGGKPAAEAVSDDKGNFEIQLPVGKMRYMAGNPTTVGYKGGTITIEAGKTADLPIQLGKPIHN